MPLLGIDTASPYQHPRNVAFPGPEGQPIDWAAAFGAGVRWAGVKLTEDDSYINPNARNDVDGARGVGIVVVGYHFSTMTVDPRREAAHFSAVAGALELGELAFDLERGDLRNPGAIAARVRTFAGVRPFDFVYWPLGYRRALRPLIFDLYHREWLAAPGNLSAGDAAIAAGADVVQYGQGEIAGVGGGPCDLNHVNYNPTKVAPMYDPPITLAPIVADLACPTGGAWVLGRDGGVYAFGGAPFHGSAAGADYFAGRTAARLEARDDGQPGYEILDSAGEVYRYPT